MTIPYHPRSSWNARPPRSAYKTFSDSRYVGMEAHHTVMGASIPWDVHARSIQNFHLDTKGWTDVFYAFGLPRSGGVVELRGWNRAQGSENTWDPDGTGITPKGYLMPVVFFGDYRTDTVTDAQREAWRWLRGELLARNPSATAQRWHSMRAATACPGGNVKTFVTLEPTTPDEPTTVVSRLTSGADMIYLFQFGYLPHYWLSSFGVLRYISKATAVEFGAGGLPIVKTTEAQIRSLRSTARAAGVLDEPGLDLGLLPDGFAPLGFVGGDDVEIRLDTDAIAKDVVKEMAKRLAT